MNNIRMYIFSIALFITKVCGLRLCRKLVLLGLISVLVSCDGSDCIYPADFGNLVVKTFQLDSSPYDGSGALKAHPDSNMRYVSESSDCSGNTLTVGWLDTGIDVVSLSHNLTIKIAGSANFCAVQMSSNGCIPSEDSSCTPVADEASSGCNSAKTLVFAHILSNHERSTYDVSSADVAADFQPDSNTPVCSGTTASADSAYYVDDHDNFVVIVPRVKEYPYKTTAQIRTEVDDLIAELSSQISGIESQKSMLQYSITQANSHTEGNDVWNDRGDNILVKIYNSSGGVVSDLGELSTGGNFVLNPPPPANVSVLGGGRKDCCFMDDSADPPACTRFDAEGINRGYFDIDLTDPDASGIDTDLYNYCEKDVFRYTGGNVTGYVKFKIEEDYTSCNTGDTDLCRCDVGGSYQSSAPSLCVMDGIGDWISGGGNGAGCWGSKVCLEGGRGGDYKGQPVNTSSYDDNSGVYTLITKSSESCIRSYETVEFRIGANTPANAKILTGNRYDTVPWNTGRLYVRVIDPKILERGNRECHWVAPGGPGVAALQDLYSNNVGKFRITVRTVEVDEVITGLKDLLFDKFNTILNRGFQERYYNQLVGSSQFQHLLTIAVALYIAFTAMGFLMGVTNINQHDLVMRLIKIGLIYTVLSPNGWQFFSYLIDFFEDGAEHISVMLAGGFIEESDGAQVSNRIYALLDEIVYMFFQPEIHQKISAVFFSPILVGVVLFVFIYYALFLMLYAIAKSILIYLVIKIVFAILFMVGPVFIVFSLFEKTKQVFEQWLNMVISYSMQLIFLLLCIAFFSSLILNIFYDIFYYGVCWKPVWIIKLGALPEFEFFSFWRFHGFDSRYTEAYNVSKGPDFTSVLFLLVVAYCFKQMIDKVSDLGDAVAAYGGVGAGSMAASLVKDTFGSIGDAVKSTGKNVALPMAGTALHAGLKMAKPMRMGISAGIKGVESGMGASGRFALSVKRDGARAAIKGGIQGAASNVKGAASRAKDSVSCGIGNVAGGVRNFYKSGDKMSQMLNAKDKIGAMLNKADISNADFLDVPGNMQRRIGAGSLLNDNAMMDKYDKIMSQSIKGAKQRGLSGKEAKKFAIDSANRALKSLDLPKDKAEEVKKRMQGDIKAQNIGVLKKSSFMDSVSKTTLGKKVLSGISKNYVSDALKPESNTARELIFKKAEQAKELSKKEEASRKKIAELSDQMQKIEKDRDYKKIQRYIEAKEKRIAIQREQLEMLEASKNDRPLRKGRIKDRIAKLEGEVKKLNQQGAKGKMRSLEAQMRLHKDNLNDAVDSKLGLSRDRQNITRDQVLSSADRIKDFRERLSTGQLTMEEKAWEKLSGKKMSEDQFIKDEIASLERMNRGADLLSAERIKELQDEIASLEKKASHATKNSKKFYEDKIDKCREELNKDVEVDFGAALKEAMDDPERYAKSVADALVEDRDIMKEDYAHVAGGELVSKLDADRGDDDGFGAVGIGGDQGGDLPADVGDKPKAVGSRESEGSKRVLEARVSRARSDLRNERNKLKSASSADNKKDIEAKISDLESQISILDSKIQNMNG